MQNIRHTFHYIYFDKTIIIENKNIKNISFFVNTPQLTETQTQYFCLNITQNTVVVLLLCLTRENFFKTFCNNIGLLFPFFSPTKYKREPKFSQPPTLVSRHTTTTRRKHHEYKNVIFTYLR